MTRCRDCKLYDLDAVRSSSGRILSNRVAECRWEMPDIAWPESIVASYSGIPKPNRRYMEPHEGESCAAFAIRNPTA
jgi:hypothetical protein